MTDMPITTLEEPRIDQYRETHIEWSERIGGSSREIKLETYLTAEELMHLVDKLSGGTR